MVMAQALGLCNLRDGLPAPENRDMTYPTGIFWAVQIKLLSYMIIYCYMIYIYYMCIYIYIILLYITK